MVVLSSRPHLTIVDLSGLIHYVVQYPDGVLALVGMVALSLYTESSLSAAIGHP